MTAGKDLKLIHYHAPRTRSATVRWLLHELDAPHELKVLDLKKGEHKQPWYLDINPMGKVPAIRHGDMVVTEAAAIALYLADLFPQAGLAPTIGDTRRGTYLRWIIFNQAAVEPAVVDHALKRAPGPPSTLPYGTYEATVDALAGALRPGPFILGDKFSAADIVVGSGVRWMLMFKLLPERPEFIRYVEHLVARPASQRAAAEDERLLAGMGA